MLLIICPFALHHSIGANLINIDFLITHSHYFDYDDVVHCYTLGILVFFIMSILYVYVIIYATGPAHTYIYIIHFQ